MTPAFLLFGQTADKPSAKGGWWDFLGSYASLESAKEGIAELVSSGVNLAWWHLVDFKAGIIVEHGPAK